MYLAYLDSIFSLLSIRNACIVCIHPETARRVSFSLTYGQDTYGRIRV